MVWNDRHCGRGFRWGFMRARNGDLEAYSSCVCAVHSRRARVAQDGRRRDIAKTPAHPRRCTCFRCFWWPINCVSPHRLISTRRNNAGSGADRLWRESLLQMFVPQNVWRLCARTLTYAHHSLPPHAVTSTTPCPTNHRFDPSALPSGQICTAGTPMSWKQCIVPRT